MGYFISIEKNLKTIHIIIASIILEAILFYLYYSPETKVLMGDETRYLAAANSIINGGDWHPTPVWPPLQSILIAGFLKLFNGSLLHFQIFQYLLLVASGFIVKDIVFKETQSLLAAKVSLAFMLLYPSWLAYSQYLWPEVTHVFTLLSLIWINNYKYNQYRWMLLAGLLLALTLLLKSLILLFVPFLFYRLIIESYKRKTYAKAFLLITLQLTIAAIILSPAAIKAHKMTGSFMISNSSMFNLKFGLIEDSRQSFIKTKGGQLFGQYLNSAEDYKTRNTIVKEQALEIIQQQGILKTIYKQLSKQYFRLFEHHSFFSIQFRGDKQHGYKNTYSHDVNNFFIWSLLLYDKLIYTLLIMLSIAGLIYSLKKSLLSQQFLLFLLYNLALFLILHAKTRFRIPMLPVFVFYSGYLITMVQSILKKNISIVELKGDKLPIFIVLIFIILALCFIYLGPFMDFYFPI